MDNTAPYHVFESAGLGRAPFRFVGAERRVVVVGFGENATIKPGASCQYCYTAIIECCLIKGSDGRVFHVGNECVKKTGDKGIINPAKQAVNKLRNEARKEREALHIAETVKLLDRPEVLAALISQPHPNKFMATQKQKTLLDYVRFLLESGGHTGKLNAAKTIEYQAKKAALL